MLMDSQINKKNANKLFDMIEKCAGLSLTIVGLQTKIILDLKSRLYLKNANISLKNLTFAKCYSSYFEIIDSSLYLYNIRFLGNGYYFSKALLNLINCTSVMTSVSFKNHNRPLLFANSSILLSQFMHFDNITIESSEFAVIRLVTTSLESSYTNLRQSNVSNLLKLNNSNVFISNFNSTNSIFTSSLLYSVFSNILVRNVFLKKCNGPILSSINESTFHISNTLVKDHFSEYPLFTVSNASLSVIDSQFSDSQINSIVSLYKCTTFYFTNSTIIYLMATKTLFEIEKTNSAEFSQVYIYRLVSQTDIGILHAINSDYAKISQLMIEGLVSQNQRSSAFAFSDVSSIYLDDFNYTQNGAPLMIVSQSNVVFANSYISQNECIEYAKSPIPSSFITLLTESSLHLIRCQVIRNSAPEGFFLLSLNSIVYFKKITFSKNEAAIQFIQSDVKFSKSVFKNNFGVIESHFSNINIYKCLFASSKKNLQIFAGNGTKIIINTTIINSTCFIEADPSATSVTIGAGRFLYSYEQAISVDTKRTKLLLLDTKFNCSNECESVEIKSDPIFDRDKSELHFPQSTQFLLTNVKEIITENNNINEENKSHKSSYTLSSKPFINHLDINNSTKANSDGNTSVINLSEEQSNYEFQVWIVVLPVLFLCTLLVYRFKSPKFRKMSQKTFSQKGRYQL